MATGACFEHTSPPTSYGEERRKEKDMKTIRLPRCSRPATRALAGNPGLRDPHKMGVSRLSEAPGSGLRTGPGTTLLALPVSVSTASEKTLP